MTTMFDAVTPRNIPADAEIVAGYVDGRYAWTASDWARFPNAQKVTITVLGRPGARVADIEKSDLTPASGAWWANHEIALGNRPTLYCSASARPQVVQALAHFNLEFVRDVDCWVADYDHHAVVPPGCVAKQYADPGPYDVSVTDGFWPARKVAPMYDPPIYCHPIVASAFVGATQQFYLLAQDGGVFTFGGAPFHGSPVNDPRTAGKNYRWVAIEADAAGYTCVTDNNLRFGYPHQ